ncbi:MAG: Lrp/AsnC family transcriptional regulator [Candidatus Helarchaeota archaeon]
MSGKKGSSAAKSAKNGKKNVKIKIDDLDLEILRKLKEDSRVPFTKLAEILKIPDTTVHFRVKKLREMGIIQKFTISISPKNLEYDLLSMIKIRIGGHIVPDISNKRLEDLTDSLKRIKNIHFLACSDTENSIYALIYTKDKDELLNIVKEIQSVDFIEFDVWQFSKIIKGENMYFEL